MWICAKSLDNRIPVLSFKDFIPLLFFKSSWPSWHDLNCSIWSKKQLRTICKYDRIFQDSITESIVEIQWNHYLWLITVCLFIYFAFGFALYRFVHLWIESGELTFNEALWLTLCSLMGQSPYVTLSYLCVKSFHVSLPMSQMMSKTWKQKQQNTFQQKLWKSEMKSKYDKEENRVL